MKSKFILILLVIAAIIGGGIYYFSLREPDSITLTGIMTTDDVIVSSQMQGRLQQLLVNVGDTVKDQQLLAVIESQEHQADAAYYQSSQQQYAAPVKQAETDLESARLTYERDQPLLNAHAVSSQDYDQARLAYEGVKMRVELLKMQADAAGQTALGRDAGWHGVLSGCGCGLCDAAPCEPKCFPG